MYYSFDLAERLGMTVEELGLRMSSWEFSAWVLKDKIHLEREKKRQADADVQMRAKHMIQNPAR